MIRRGPLTPALLVDLIDVQGSCWLWVGRFDREGYGRFGKYAAAHRLVYELLIGPIPAGLQIDHLCQVKPCMNPDHMEPVTAFENQRRARRRYRHVCRHGHRRTSTNTYVDPRGEKWCRPCKRRNQAAYLVRKVERP